MVRDGRFDDSLSTQDTVVRERGSPDSVRARYSTPLMPDLQCSTFNQTKRNKRQQDGFIDREYYYPAKPKHAWSLGIRGSTAMINGDINQNFFLPRSQTAVCRVHFWRICQKPRLILCRSD